MKLLATQDFSRKVSALPAAAKSQVGKLVTFLEDADEKSIFSTRSTYKIQSLDQGIVAFRTGILRIIATVERAARPPYLLLLDMTSDRALESSTTKPLFAIHDPRQMGSINPLMNPSLNPSRNPSINPRMNPSINPRHNPTINPRMNPTINPRMNPTINPRMNPMINPRMNPMINPRMNPMINPRTNSSLGGPYVYDLRLAMSGFLTQANDITSLEFGLDLSQRYIHVETGNHDVSVFFDEGLTWCGFTVKAGNEVTLTFSVEGEWVGFIV